MRTLTVRLFDWTTMKNARDKKGRGGFGLMSRQVVRAEDGRAACLKALGKKGNERFSEAYRKDVGYITRDGKKGHLYR